MYLKILELHVLEAEIILEDLNLLWSQQDTNDAPTIIYLTPWRRMTCSNYSESKEYRDVYRELLTPHFKKVRKMLK